MSKKRTTYSSAFKTKLVLELLQNADTLADQYSDGPFDVKRITIAMNSIIINNDNNNITPKNKSKIRFIKI